MEVLGIVEQNGSQFEGDTDQELVKRRAALANAYRALPEYGSTEFWSIVEEPDLKVALSLEILVKCTRVAIASGDDTARNRIVEVIVRRTQASNEYWARHVLNRVHLRPEERSILVRDLYADLCEHLIRALMDMKRLFWEENFQHCMLFERKHVFQAFMTREGLWLKQHREGVVGRRIPRMLIASIDQPVLHANGEFWEPDFEDEQAQQALLSVEQSDLPLLVLHLPEKLKAVILLIFWEGRTEKDTARILGVTDRTVRNRLSEALKSLRHILVAQGGTMYE